MLTETGLDSPPFILDSFWGRLSLSQSSDRMYSGSD